MKRFAIGIFSVGVLGLDAASGQNFPTKPIRMLAGEVGGSSDDQQRDCGYAACEVRQIEGFGSDRAQPSALLPGLPTVAASGLPGYETLNMFGLLAPAGTPIAIINRLSKETALVLSQADEKEKLFNVGAEVVGSSPAEFAAAIKSETAKMAKVIKSAGITAD